VGESRIVPLRDAAPGDFDPIDQDLAGGGRLQRGEQLGLRHMKCLFEEREEPGQLRGHR